jgi:L-Ala-D/L-Glu epimerase
MARIAQIVLRHLRQPLIRPYRLSYRTFEEFEPYLIEVTDDRGTTGFADGHISPGSSSETREGGWSFLQSRIREVLGQEIAAAKPMLLAHFSANKVATTAIVCALEVLERHALLNVSTDAELPLLTPINASEPDEIEREVEAWLAQGFRTFKIKVGKDIDADLRRVRLIQQASRNRATLRLDANRAYSRADGIRLASSLDPTGIELFEQPCDSEDWEANAAVAAASAVPLMLDEPICTLADVERAATIKGVGFCKLKLKRFGSLDRLHEGLERVRACGMEPVLGDGLGSEVHSWLEAAVARLTIRNAGEFNGFLKPHDRLLDPPLTFARGAIHLNTGYWPRLDPDAIRRFTIKSVVFDAERARVTEEHHGA